MSLDMFRSLLQGLGATIGIAELAPDGEGFCSMQIGERTIVNMQYDGERQEVILFARLGEVAEDLREAAYEMLLAGNLFWQQTNGGMLSVEPSTRPVYLAPKQAIRALAQPRFEAMLNEFVEAAERWQRELESLAATEEGPLPPEEPAGQAPPPHMQRV